MKQLLETARVGEVVAAYLDRSVLPAASVGETFRFVGLAMILHRAAPTLVENNIGMLRAAGLVDNQGRIIINEARNFGKELINRAGKLSLLGFSFGVDDIDTLCDIAARYAVEEEQKDD